MRNAILLAGAAGLAAALAACVPTDMTTASADPNVSACLNAVAAQTNNSVAVLSSEFSEANTVVMVGVGTQMAPWRCLVSNGVVAEVTYVGGDEGYL